MNGEELSETAQKIVSQAPNWNFEGDCSILQWMEQISKNLEIRAKATTESLDNLTKNLSRAQIGLENTQNSLNALQYTQYVEMRCQEDESNTETTNIPSKQEVEPKQDLLKVFLQNNLKMLHNCHDKFNFLEDSEEDEAGYGVLAENNCIYQPRNPYNDRLLPHIYGTKLWKENWHVGLCEEGIQDFSGDEKSDVYSLSPSSSSESESMESHNAENLSQWTSSVSLNNDGFSNSINPSVTQNYSAAPSTILEVPFPKTISIPESSNIVIEKETMPIRPTDVETVDSSQSLQKNRTTQCKTLNLFDDNDFKSLMSEITNKNKQDKSINQEKEKRSPVRIAQTQPKVDLFASRSNSPNFENTTPTQTQKTSFPETNQTFSQKIIPSNIFDSPTDEIPPIQNFKSPTQQSKVDLFEDISTEINYGNENFLPAKQTHEKTMISAKSLFDDDDDEDFLKIFGKKQATTITGSENRTFNQNTNNEQRKKEISFTKVSSVIAPSSLFDDDDTDLLFTQAISQKPTKRIQDAGFGNFEKNLEPSIQENDSIHHDMGVHADVLQRKNIFSDENDDFENNLSFEKPKSKKSQETIQVAPPIPAKVDIENQVVLSNPNNDLTTIDDFDDNILNKGLANKPNEINTVKEKSVESISPYLAMKPPEDIENQLKDHGSTRVHNDDKPESYPKVDLFDSGDFAFSNESVKTLNSDFEYAPKTSVETPITKPSTTAETLKSNTPEKIDHFNRKPSTLTVENSNDSNTILKEITQPVKEVPNETLNEVHYEKDRNSEKHVNIPDRARDTLPSLFDDTPPEFEDTSSRLSEDIIDKGSIMKTSGYDNFSPLFLDEPPDDDFFQAVSGNITSTQSNLENDFFEPTLNKTKVSTENKSEDPALIPRGYNIGLFSDIPPDDEEIHDVASTSYISKSDSIVSPSNLDITTAVESCDSLSTEEFVGADIQDFKVTKKIISQQVETLTDIPPKATASKLKMPNININVNALLPGAIGKSVKANTNTFISVRDEKLPTTEILEPTQDENSPIEVRLDGGRENILPSLCKNRVRGPVKRRASTRAGRQESYQRSLETAQKEAEIDESLKNEMGSKKSHNTFNTETSTNDQTNPKVDFNSYSKQPVNVKKQPPQKQTSEVTATQYSLPKNQMEVKSKLFDDFNENEDNKDLFSNAIGSIDTKDVNKKPQSISNKSSSMLEHTTQAGLSSHETKKPLPKLPAPKVCAFQQEPIPKRSGSNLFDDSDENEDTDDFFSSLDSKKEKVKGTKTEDDTKKSESFLPTPALIDDHKSQEKSLSFDVNKSLGVLPSNPSITNAAPEVHQHNLTKKPLSTERKLFDDFEENEDNDDFFTNLVKPKTAKPNIERSTITTQQSTPTNNKSLNDLFAADLEKHQEQPKSTKSQGGASVIPKPANTATLFESDSTDDDNDLFRASSKPKSNVQINSKILLNTAKTKGKQQSLFSDSEDDDDLFGSGPSKADSKVLSEPKPTQQAPKNIKPLMARTQPETSKTTDNPLADLLDS